MKVDQQTFDKIKDLYGYAIAQEHVGRRVLMREFDISRSAAEEVLEEIRNPTVDPDAVVVIDSIQEYEYDDEEDIYTFYATDPFGEDCEFSEEGRVIRKMKKDYCMRGYTKKETALNSGYDPVLFNDLRKIFDWTHKSIPATEEEMRERKAEEVAERLAMQQKKADARKELEKKKKRELEKLTSTDKNEREELNLNWKNNIHLCRQKVEERTEKVREASNTVNFGKRADILEEIFDDFINKYLTRLKENQIEETNERLQKILGLSEVQIKDIDNSIQIEGKEDVSEGQRLSVAYAYLSTLFEDSAVDVPFVIDSPAVSIDYEKRAEVAPIISNLFDQLVIFLISSEREHFVSELESGDIKYCTVHKTEIPGEVEKKLDKNYFMSFQSEDEEQEIEEVA